MRPRFLALAAAALLLLGGMDFVATSTLAANTQKPVKLKLPKLPKHDQAPAAEDAAPRNITIRAEEGAVTELTSELRRALDADVSRVIVRIEHTEGLRASVLAQFEQEVRSVLDANNYPAPNGRIVRCRWKCGASGPGPRPSSDVEISGNVIKLKISALDGPMPSTRRGLQTAQARRIARAIAYIENTSLSNDPELVDLVELETRELLDQFGFRAPKGTIVKCPRKCGERPAPPDPPDNGPPAYATVNAIDGPMPRFVAAVKAARARRASRVIVNLENTDLLDEPEVLELVELEIWDILKRYRYGPSKAQIIRCERAC